MRKVFLGEFQHSIDRQRRISIPREWRSVDGLEQEFYLMPGRDGGVQVMPRDYFMSSIFDKLKDTPSADSDRLLAQIGRKGHECVCDKQGRINLSPQLVEQASLELPDQVQLIGAVHYFEIRPVEEKEDDVEQFLDMLEAIQKRKAIEE